MSFDLTESHNLRIGDSDLTRINNFRKSLRLSLLHPGHDNMLRAIRLLEARDDVFGVSPNFTVLMPPQHYIEHQNNLEPFFAPLNSTTQNWGLNNINAEAARGITRGNTNVKVGIISWGINGNHPDLRVPLSRHPHLHRDFNTARSQPLQDGNYLGTNSAGIIAAQNQGNTRTSIAENISLISLRTDSNPAWIENAILYAIVTGIHILHISHFGARTRHVGMENALRDFDGLAVIGAGYAQLSAGEHNNDVHNRYPANLAHPRYNIGGNVISVGASNQSNNRSVTRQNVMLFLTMWVGSHYGRNTVCLFAPGYRTLTTSGNIYSNIYRGTHLAAAHVAGAAALMLSANPHLTGAQMREILKTTANTSVGSCIRDGSISRGRLNAYAAVRQAVRVASTPGLRFVPIFENNRRVAYSAAIGTAAASHIIIPSEHNGLPVTRIANDGFRGSAISSIYISYRVTHIGDFAFERSTNLHTVLFANNSRLVSIGGDAFAACHGLENIVLPESLIRIYSWAFWNTWSITSLIIPRNVTYVGALAFGSHNPNLNIIWHYNPAMTAANFRSFLREVYIPHGIRQISANAFVNVRFAETDIIIPSTVSTIGENAFRINSDTYLRIFSKATGQPAGWHANFNPLNRPVYFYSTEQPTTVGRHWRMINGVPTPWAGLTRYDPLFDTNGTLNPLALTRLQTAIAQTNRTAQ
ncbi:MAG: leucine-rich repeat protein, partial [Firmicutes bacterium]|nr:leucine-rich repeat protein [Bacillota bacterium]